MIRLRPIAWILCLALAAAPLAAQEPPTSADYARREADSPGLDDYRGGFHILAAGVCVAALVATAILIDLEACPTCRHRLHGHYEELPPAMDRNPVRP